MSPVRRRRRMPTLINRGLGLLEVIMPRGYSEDDESCLPPGQRDGSGFWFPEGYDRPGEIFTTEQRKMQAMQRQIQKRRCTSVAAPAFPASGDGIMAVHGSSGAAHSPPARPPVPKRPLQVEDEVALPLPPALPEAASVSRRTLRPKSSPPLPGPAGPVAPGRFTDEDLGPPRRQARVVDSRGGSE